MIEPQYIIHLELWQTYLNTNIYITWEFKHKACYKDREIVRRE